MTNIYDVELLTHNNVIPVEILETDIDLYYHIALTLYNAIEQNNQDGKPSVFILPVGPVFQYRRFVMLCRMKRLDLSKTHCFFMDEYLTPDGNLIDPCLSLSFRGFIDREFIQQLSGSDGLKTEHVYFPNPENPAEYDQKLEMHGGAQICVAGVGINGHVAFNEPPQDGNKISIDEYKNLPTRVIHLSRETITINSNTALNGAYELMPPMAITIGFYSIFSSKKILIYLNRSWQNAVVRKLLFGEKTVLFPASLLRDHHDIRIYMTKEVAEDPNFELR